MENPVQQRTKIAVALGAGALIVLALSVASCSNSTNTGAQYVPQAQMAAPAAPVTVQAAPPVVVQQAPQESHMVRDMLLGGMLGHMIGGRTTGAAPAPQVIERRTVVNHYAAPAPAARPAPAPTPAPAVKPSYGAAYNASKPFVSSRPSFSRPSRPSYGGFRSGRR